MFFLGIILLFHQQGFCNNNEDSLDAYLTNDSTYHERNADDQSAKKIDKIVVTADRKEKDLKDVVLPVSIVDDDQIEENLFVSMVDVLDDTPGFTQVYEYHSPILLRGISSSRILFLKDMNLRMSSYPEGFMGQTANIYDIERIEIIRGPGSVIYGSGATTGIINMISRDVFKDIGWNIKIGAGFGLNDIQLLGLGTINYTASNFAFQLAGRYRKTTNYTYGNGMVATNSFTEDKDLSFRMGYLLPKDGQITFTSDLHFGGPWGKPFGFNRNLMKAGNENDNSYYFALDFQQETTGVFDEIYASVFYNYETREYHKQMVNVLHDITDETIVNYLDQYGGGHFHVFLDKMKHQLIMGMDGSLFRLWSPQTTVNYIHHTTNSDIGTQGSGVSSTGIFAQDTWELSDRSEMVIGLRYDIASVLEGDNPTDSKYLLGYSNTYEIRGALSGNLGLIYHPVTNTSLTFNVGRAFRMPSANEMFSEQVTCGGIVSGNPGLQPEYSLNFDAGFKGEYRDFEWDFALFANYYHQLIQKVSADSSEAFDQIYTNTDLARIIGAEIETSYTFKDIFGEGHDLIPGITFTAYSGDDLSDGSGFGNLFASNDPLSGIPPFRFKASLRYKAYFLTWSYFIEINMDHYFKKLRVPEVESEAPWSNEDIDPYTLFNIIVGISLDDVWGIENIKLNIKIQNLFNKEFYPFGSYILGKGRDVKLFVGMEF